MATQLKNYKDYLTSVLNNIDNTRDAQEINNLNKIYRNSLDLFTDPAARQVLSQYFINSDTTGNVDPAKERVFLTDIIRLLDEQIRSNPTITSVPTDLENLVSSYERARERRVATNEAINRNVDSVFQQLGTSIPASSDVLERLKATTQQYIQTSYSNTPAGARLPENQLQSQIAQQLISQTQLSESQAQGLASTILSSAQNAILNAQQSVETQQASTSSRYTTFFDDTGKNQVIRDTLQNVLEKVPYIATTVDANELAAININIQDTVSETITQASPQTSDQELQTKLSQALQTSSLDDQTRQRIIEETTASYNAAREQYIQNTQNQIRQNMLEQVTTTIDNIRTESNAQRNEPVPASIEAGETGSLKFAAQRLLAKALGREQEYLESVGSAITFGDKEYQVLKESVSDIVNNAAQTSLNTKSDDFVKSTHTTVQNKLTSITDPQVKAEYVDSSGQLTSKGQQVADQLTLSITEGYLNQKEASYRQNVQISALDQAAKAVADGITSSRATRKTDSALPPSNFDTVARDPQAQRQLSQQIQTAINEAIPNIGLQTNALDAEATLLQSLQAKNIDPDIARTVAGSVIGTILQKQEQYRVLPDTDDTIRSTQASGAQFQNTIVPPSAPVSRQNIPNPNDLTNIVVPTVKALQADPRPNPNAIIKQLRREISQGTLIPSSRLNGDLQDLSTTTQQLDSQIKQARAQNRKEEVKRLRKYYEEKVNNFVDANRTELESALKIPPPGNTTNQSNLINILQTQISNGSITASPALETALQDYSTAQQEIETKIQAAQAAGDNKELSSLRKESAYLTNKFIRNNREEIEQATQIPQKLETLNNTMAAYAFAGAWNDGEKTAAFLDYQQERLRLIDALHRAEDREVPYTIERIKEQIARLDAGFLEKQKPVIDSFYAAPETTIENQNIFSSYYANQGSDETKLQLLKKALVQNDVEEITNKVFKNTPVPNEVKALLVESPQLLSDMRDQLRAGSITEARAQQILDEARIIQNQVRNQLVGDSQLIKFTTENWYDNSINLSRQVDSGYQEAKANIRKNILKEFGAIQAEKEGLGNLTTSKARDELVALRGEKWVKAREKAGADLSEELYLTLANRNDTVRLNYRDIEAISKNASRRIITELKDVTDPISRQAEIRRIILESIDTGLPANNSIIDNKLRTNLITRIQSSVDQTAQTLVKSKKLDQSLTAAKVSPVVIPGLAEAQGNIYDTTIEKTLGFGRVRTESPLGAPLQSERQAIDESIRDDHRMMLNEYLQSLGLNADDAQALSDSAIFSALGGLTLRTDKDGKQYWEEADAATGQIRKISTVNDIILSKYEDKITSTTLQKSLGGINLQVFDATQSAKVATALNQYKDLNQLERHLLNSGDFKPQQVYVIMDYLRTRNVSLAALSPNELNTLITQIQNSEQERIIQQYLKNKDLNALREFLQGNTYLTQQQMSEVLKAIKETKEVKTLEEFKGQIPSPEQQRRAIAVEAAIQKLKASGKLTEAQLEQVRQTLLNNFEMVHDKRILEIIQRSEKTDGPKTSALLKSSPLNSIRFWLRTDSGERVLRDIVFQKPLQYAASLVPFRTRSQNQAQIAFNSFMRPNVASRLFDAKVRTFASMYRLNEGEIRDALFNGKTPRSLRLGSVYARKEFAELQSLHNAIAAGAQWRATTPKWLVNLVDARAAVLENETYTILETLWKTGNPIESVFNLYANKALLNIKDRNGNNIFFWDPATKSVRHAGIYQWRQRLDDRVRSTRDNLVKKFLKTKGMQRIRVNAYLAKRAIRNLLKKLPLSVVKFLALAATGVGAVAKLAMAVLNSPLFKPLWDLLKLAFFSLVIGILRLIGWVIGVVGGLVSAIGSLFSGLGAATGGLTNVSFPAFGGLSGGLAFNNALAAIGTQFAGFSAVMANIGAGLSAAGAGLMNVFAGWGQALMSLGAGGYAVIAIAWTTIGAILVTAHYTDSLKDSPDALGATSGVVTTNPLNITKIASQTAVPVKNGPDDPNPEVTFTIRVNAPPCASPMTVTDILPANLSYVPGSISYDAPQAPITSIETNDTNPSELIWTLNIDPINEASCAAAGGTLGAVDFRAPNDDATRQIITEIINNTNNRYLAGSIDTLMTQGTAKNVNALAAVAIMIAESSLGEEDPQTGSGPGTGIGAPASRGGCFNPWGAVGLHRIISGLSLCRNIGGVEFTRFDSYEQSITYLMNTINNRLNDIASGAVNGVSVPPNSTLTVEYFTAIYIPPTQHGNCSAWEPGKENTDLGCTTGHNANWKRNVAGIMAHKARSPFGTIQEYIDWRDGSGETGGTPQTVPNVEATLTYRALVNNVESLCIRNNATLRAGTYSNTGSAGIAVGDATCSDVPQIPAENQAIVDQLCAGIPGANGKTVVICPTINTLNPPKEAAWTTSQLTALWNVAHRVAANANYANYAVGDYEIEITRSECYVAGGTMYCPPLSLIKGYNAGIGSGYQTRSATRSKLIFITDNVIGFEGNVGALEWLYAHEIGHSAQHGTVAGGIGGRDRNPAYNDVVAACYGNEKVSSYGVSAGPSENNADSLSFYMTEGERAINGYTGGTNPVAFDMKQDYPCTYTHLKGPLIQGGTDVSFFGGNEYGL